MPTLGLPWAPLEDGPSNSPSFVSDSFLCLGLDYVAVGQLLEGRMWDPWSKLFTSCRKTLEPTEKESHAPGYTVWAGGYASDLGL